MKMDLFSENATVVLVHGAWADGSSWKRVILPLLHQGLKVICAPIPLTSLSDDAAALNRVLQRTDGPVLLGGHAYAGAVIAGSDEKVSRRGRHQSLR
jgi:pimeloyl-ACP methyl ester carboxylesterase